MGKKQKKLSNRSHGQDIVHLNVGNTGYFHSHWVWIMSCRSTFPSSCETESTGWNVQLPEPGLCLSQPWLYFTLKYKKCIRCWVAKYKPFPNDHSVAFGTIIHSLLEIFIWLLDTSAGFLILVSPYYQ